MKFILILFLAALASTHAFIPLRIPPRTVAHGGWRRGKATAMETTPGASPNGVENLKKLDTSAQQAFIQPAVHNSNGVRVAAILTAAALASKGTLLVPGNLSKFLHILAYAAWTGTTFWTTFVAGLTMRRNLPRQMFGKIQSKLFPAYFQLNFSAILTIFIIRGFPLGTRAGVTLIVSLCATFLNLVLLEPKSTSIMFKRYELENENKEDSDECKELGKKFRLFHGLSSFVNLGALIGSVVYAWELASMLPA